MSTRAVIARANKFGFTGVYHHWDGYPSGLGKTLFNLSKKMGIKSMLKLLIDDHTEGWSSIVGADFALPAVNMRNQKNLDENHGPLFYKNEGSNLLNQNSALDLCCDFAYIFRGTKMRIYIAKPNSWSKIANVDLTGPEPDFNKMD